jgi:hypothetical protein
MVKRYDLLLVGLMMVPLSYSVAEVYRSVDKDGNVTYTDTRPETGQEVERVKIHEGPSEESLRHTLERNRAIREAAETAREKRLKQQSMHRAKLAKAQEEVDIARENLEKARALSSGDRQMTVGGKTRIRPEYYQRIEEAEEKLETAKKKLKEMRGN